MEVVSLSSFLHSCSQMFSLRLPITLVMLLLWPGTVITQMHLLSRALKRRAYILNWRGDTAHKRARERRPQIKKRNKFT